tara:strand:- start:32 stop:655 length:624 start_codon:yes stop_codon:yes gene_type:complete
MTFEITDYPDSYVKVKFKKKEKIIVEKGCFIYCDGEYDYENKIEAKSYKNWIAKIFGGKSLTYNIYSAKENVEMALSPKDTAEIICLDVSRANPIMFSPSSHFMRTFGLEIKLISLLKDSDILLKTLGSGKLFLKGYGKIIEKNIDSINPIYVDEDALVAFEQKLEYGWISGGVNKLFTSGEGFTYTFKGKGKVWIQSKEKIEYKND